MVFSFGSFALVVGFGGGVVLAGDERGDEHGVFEAVVTSAVLGDAVDAFAGSSVDGRESGVGAEACSV